MTIAIGQSPCHRDYPHRSTSYLDANGRSGAISSILRFKLEVALQTSRGRKESLIAAALEDYPHHPELVTLLQLWWHVVSVAAMPGSGFSNSFHHGGRQVGATSDQSAGPPESQPSSSIRVTRTGRSDPHFHLTRLRSSPRSSEPASEPAEIRRLAKDCDAGTAPASISASRAGGCEIGIAHARRRSSSRVSETGRPRKGERRSGLGLDAVQDFRHLAQVDLGVRIRDARENASRVTVISGLAVRNALARALDPQQLRGAAWSPLTVLDRARRDGTCRSSVLEARATTRVCRPRPCASCSPS